VYGHKHVISENRIIIGKDMMSETSLHISIILETKVLHVCGAGFQIVLRMLFFFNK
jgi:hypothetical protein